MWPQTQSGKVRQTAVSWRADADFIYFPVREIKREPMQKVFDLQVPSDQSFIAGRTVVHNCQIMGGVARELGFAGYLPELCDPAVGLEYSCRHLKRYYTKYGNWPDTIASYNAGSPRKIGEIFVNQSYVDKVQTAWNAFDTQDQL